MPRKTTSQWDFAGDLFGDGKPASPGAPARPVPVPKPAREVLSVGDFTRQLREVLEGRFGSVSVRGEVSNFRMQPSGHAYFVLKDAAAAVSCVLFRGQSGVNRALFRDGASLILGGEVTVYEPRGQYQLRVTSAEAVGVGALQAAFEELKRRLAAEGLFDPARKRPIPVYPRGLGIVTSASAAALQDVLHVIGRRHPGLPLVLAAARVQGQGAAEEIAEAIGALNQWAAAGGGIDVILVTRGGGSIEDLWAFNEERVARAIAASPLPVVSAVGHEIDFTISDFVADLRAATPSAAAELLTAGYVASRERVAQAAGRLPRLLLLALSSSRRTVDDLRRRLGRVHPRRRVEELEQRLDDLSGSLSSVAGRALRDRMGVVDQFGQRLWTARPSARFQASAREVSELRRRLLAAGRLRQAVMAERLARLGDRLRLLSPQAILDRGYSITLDARTGAVIRDPSQVQPGQQLESRVARGRIRSRVEEGGAAPAG